MDNTFHLWTCVSAFATIFNTTPQDNDTAPVENDSYETWTSERSSRIRMRSSHARRVAIAQAAGMILQTLPAKVAQGSAEDRPA